MTKSILKKRFPKRRITPEQMAHGIVDTQQGTVWNIWFALNGDRYGVLDVVLLKKQIEKHMPKNIYPYWHIVTDRTGYDWWNKYSIMCHDMPKGAEGVWSKLHMIFLTYSLPECNDANNIFFDLDMSIYDDIEWLFETPGRRFELISKKYWNEGRETSTDFNSSIMKFNMSFDTDAHEIALKLNKEDFDLLALQYDGIDSWFQKNVYHRLTPINTYGKVFPLIYSENVSFEDRSIVLYNGMYSTWNMEDQAEEVKRLLNPQLYPQPSHQSE